MIVETRKDKIDLIPENEYDKKALKTNIKVILNNNSELVKYMKKLSYEECILVYNALWRAYCAGTHDGRVARQIEMDSKSYTP